MARPGAPSNLTRAAEIGRGFHSAMPALVRSHVELQPVGAGQSATGRYLEELREREEQD